MSKTEMKKMNKLNEIFEDILNVTDKEYFVIDFLENISHLTSIFIFSTIQEWRGLQKDKLLSEDNLQNQFSFFKEGIEAKLKINYLQIIEYLKKLELIFIKKDKEFISHHMNEIKAVLPKEADQIDEAFAQLIKDIGGFND